MSQKSRKRTHEVDVDDNEPMSPKRQMRLRSSKGPALSVIDVNSQDHADPSEQSKRRRVINISHMLNEEHAARASVSQLDAPIESPEPPPQTGLADLPVPDVTDQIIAHLDSRSIKAATEASSVLNQAFDKSASLNNFKLCIDYKILHMKPTISRSYKFIKLVNFVDRSFEYRCGAFENYLVPWIGHSVKEIKLENFNLTSSHLIRILRHFPNLESLVMRRVKIGGTKPMNEFRIPNLRRVDCDVVSMIELIQDFLVDCKELVEISVRGAYPRDTPDFLVNPTIDVFRVLRSLIMRQENLRTLWIGDSTLFRNGVENPLFQLQSLCLRMKNVSNVELPNLLAFLRSQHGIEAMSFNISIESNERQPDFERSLDYVLNMPTLTNLAMRFYGGIGMRQVFQSNVVNKSVRILAMNFESCDFHNCFERVVQRFPMVESLWMTNIYDNDSLNLLLPLSQLRCLHMLELKRFMYSQVARVRCPQLTSLKFTSVDDEVMNLCSFLMAHPQLKDVALKQLYHTFQNEQLYELVEFVARFCPHILQLRLHTPLQVLNEERIQATVDGHMSAEFVLKACKKTFKKN